MGEAFCTGGSEAHGLLTGVGGAGGFATSCGFSGAPLRINPLPEGRLGFTEGEPVDGAGERGLSRGLFSLAAGVSAGAGAGAGADTAGVGSGRFVASSA